ncbi:hypothetical protein AYO44_05010 [Planctomycetaceae bacterium SCGC AG-212-F19]|nr:hypothetical protein AYO44_05010 [Planctomycetaceae bacterium SCGC AG-212-F19]
MPIDSTNATWLQSFNEIRLAVEGNCVWGDILGAHDSALPLCGVHLAVFVEPFLGYVLDGSKTVESRFSINRCAPFGKVSPGDVVLLKRAGGPVVGIARVRTVWSYELDESSWAVIRKRFAKALRAQAPEFWERRRGATYATLMLIDQVLALEPVKWEKRDRRGWVVVRSAGQPSLFGGDDEL